MYFLVPICETLSFKKDFVMVNLVITTWPKLESRVECLKTTVQSLKPVQVQRRIISSESAEVSPKVQADLTGWAKSIGWEIYWRTARPNLGTHLDEVFTSYVEDFILYVQDDCPLLVDSLDLTAGCNLIGTGKTDILYYYYPQIKKALRLPRFEFEGERFAYIPYDIDGLDVYGDRPFLAHKRFHTKFGPYGSGGKNGRGHEKGMDLKLKGLQIRTILRDPSVFGHIGEESVFVPGKRWGIQNPLTN